MKLEASKSVDFESQNLNSFEKLGVSPEIVKALLDQVITEPTEIQQKTIALILQGKDIIGISKTGSGKTAAFGVPILDIIERGKGLQSLVMAPTRELAVQICNELRKFGKNKKFSIVPVYGGVSLEPQIHQMRTADIVVGTPGRLKDHLQRNTINLSKVKVVVLDEADKMVEMGFIEDVETIIKYMPEKKQVLLFGATISREIEHIEKRYMHNPVTVQAESYVQEDYLKQQYYTVRQHEKFSLLVHLLKKEQAKRAMIFCSTRMTVDLVAKNLKRQGIDVESIHGKLSQNQRLKVISNFHHGHPPLIVASAVAARGLDIKDVTHIFNYDLPMDSQEYVHRIGRTARAGEMGTAITLLSERDYEAFQNILNRYRFPVEELTAGDYPRVAFDARREQSSNSSGRFGRSYGGRQDRQGQGYQRGGFSHRSQGQQRSGASEGRFHSGGSGTSRPSTTHRPTSQGRRNWG